MIRVMSWDWREQPDFDVLADILKELSNHKIRLRVPDTESDQYALVLADEPIDNAVAYEAYHQWVQSGH